MLLQSLFMPPFNTHGGGGGWGLFDKKIAGVPNLVLYGGGAILAGLAFKTLRKKGRK